MLVLENITAQVYWAYNRNNSWWWSTIILEIYWSLSWLKDVILYDKKNGHNSKIYKRENNLYVQVCTIWMFKRLSIKTKFGHGIQIDQNMIFCTNHKSNGLRDYLKTKRIYSLRIHLYPFLEGWYVWWLYISQRWCFQGENMMMRVVVLFFLIIGFVPLRFFHVKVLTSQ